MLTINFLKALSTPQQVKEHLFEMYGPKLCHTLLLYVISQSPENNVLSCFNHCYRGNEWVVLFSNPLLMLCFGGEGGRNKRRKKNTFLEKLNNNLYISFSVAGKPTHYTWMHNKTSVWHIEVYELCSVIRAYFPVVEIEIYMSLLSSTFHSIFIF